MSVDFLPDVKLAHLDFSDGQINTIKESNSNLGDKSILEINPPDELPKAINYSEIPKDFLKSSTVESLISQNDDLMARLKVTLRRLALIEKENSKLQDIARKAKESQLLISDQLMILKEKDNSWMKKIRQAEKEKEVAQEKTSSYETHLLKQKSEIERYKKYHDRIKTQIKPYVAQLKEYAKNLESSNKFQLEQLEGQEIEIQNLRNQISDLTQVCRQDKEQYSTKTQEMVDYYEGHIQKMNEELKELKEHCQELHTKSIKLNKTLEQNDLLENELIQAERLKEELKERLEKDNENLRIRLLDSTKAITYRDMELSDLKARAVSDEKLIKEQQSKLESLTEQMESLRYMWSAKNEENEKLRAAITSLEKINVGLSEKLNELIKI